MEILYNLFEEFLFLSSCNLNCEKDPEEICVVSVEWNL